MSSQKNTLYQEIVGAIQELKPASINDARKAVLQPLIDFIRERIATQEPVNLHFICTHNSRRSHLSQVWAQTMAQYFNIPAQCYSGGTEATALFPMVATTLKKQGFKIQTLATTANTIYAIKTGSNQLPIIAFSKTINDPYNIQNDFAAIMTCDSAAEACPIVLGAVARFPIMYEDPKAFDKTTQQAAKYEERSNQIATEMYHVFSQII